MISTILYRRWVNKLNIKQFKKRFIRGLVEPDLFKLPVEDYEKKICKQFTINTFFYDYYDIESNQFVGKGNACGTQIVVKNRKTSEIIYCNKHRTSLKSTVILTDIPYGEYTIRIIRAGLAIVENKEYVVNINQENYEYDILLPWMMLKIEQVFENKSLNYRVDQDRHNRVNINNVHITGGIKYKYYDLDNVSLLHQDEYIYSYMKDCLPEIRDALTYGYATDMYGNGGAESCLSIPWDYINSANYNIEYANNPNGIKSININFSYVLCITYRDDKGNIIYEEYTPDFKNPTDKMVSVCKKNHRITTTKDNEIIESVNYTADKNYAFGVYPYVYNQTENYYMLQSNCDSYDSRYYTMSNLFFNPLITYYCNELAYLNDYNINNYNLSVINKEWFKIGLNNIQCTVSNAQSSLTDTHWETVNSGVLYTFINDLYVDNEEKLTTTIESWEETTKGDVETNYYYYDFPSKINTESLFVQKLKHIISLYKLYSLDYSILYSQYHKLKYGENMFFTDMFPIETTENKEVFYSFYCFQQDFSDDYNELTAKY